MFSLAAPPLNIVKKDLQYKLVCNEIDVEEIEKKLPEGCNIKSRIIENIRLSIIDNHTANDMMLCRKPILEFDADLFQRISEELESYRRTTMMKYKKYLQQMNEILSSTHYIENRKIYDNECNIYYLDTDNKIKKLDIKDKLLNESSGFVCLSRTRAIEKHKNKNS